MYHSYHVTTQIRIMKFRNINLITYTNLILGTLLLNCTTLIKKGTYAIATSMLGKPQGGSLIHMIMAHSSNAHLFGVKTVYANSYCDTCDSVLSHG